MTIKRFRDSNDPAWELERAGKAAGEIVVPDSGSFGIEPNALAWEDDVEVQGPAPDAVARNGRNGTKAVTLGMGVIPGTGFQFFSPDGTRTILRPGDFWWESDRVTREAAYRAAALCFVALRYRAQKVSEPPLMVVNRSQKDGTSKWIARHPLEETLDDPSPDYDMGELLKRTQLYVDLTGSALWLKEKDGLGRLARLTPYSGDEFTVETSGGRLYGKFTLTNTERGDRVKTPEQVVFFQETNPADWHQGLALIDVMLGSLNFGESTTMAIRHMLRNALIPSIVVTADPLWSPNDADFARWKGALDSYALPQNKGKPLALLGGGRAQMGTLSVGNLLPETLFDRVETVIAAVSGIPAVVLSFMAGLKNSPWSQMSEARRMAYEDTIEPLWKSIEKRLTRQLLRAPIEGSGEPLDGNRNHLIEFDTSEVRALQPDRSVDSQIVERLNNAKVATGNELRAIAGLEPSTEEGWDDLPDRNAPPVLPGVPGAPGAGAPPAAGADTADDEDEADKGTDEWRARRLAAMRSTLEESTKLQPEAEADLRWKLFDANVRGQELGWLLLTSGQLEEDRTKVLRAVREVLEAKADDELPADPASVRRLMDRVDRMDLEKGWKRKAKAMVKATAEQSVSIAAADLGVSFSVLQPGVVEYVDSHVASLVTNVTGTTKDAIRTILRNGLEQGDTIRELTQKIADSGAFMPSRAQLIARTEVTEITNGAGTDSLARWSKEAGATVEKSWLSARDRRVRPDHQKLDTGEWLPVDARFGNGLTHPGEPNCRCTLIYRIPEE